MCTRRYLKSCDKRGTLVPGIFAKSARERHAFDNHQPVLKRRRRSFSPFGGGAVQAAGLDDRS